MDPGAALAQIDGASLGIVAAFIAVAFLPSVAYAAWIRNTERHSREPWRALLLAFGWGAVGGVILALVLGSVVAFPVVLMAVVVAPLTEEFAKAAGLVLVKDSHPEPEDGFIYGAAAGLGFAATENLLYELSALATGGIEAYVMTAIARTLASALLHASASALVGYGLWRLRVGGGGFGTVVVFYALAVALHGAFNFLAMREILAAFLLATAISIFVFGRIRRHIRRVDALHEPLVQLP